MARFYGLVGYVVMTETAPGVWRPKLTERFQRGNILKRSWSWRQTDQVNDDLTVSNRISFVLDSFMADNIGAIRYVVMNGSKWKVTGVDIERPRIIVTLGGLYEQKTV